MLKAKNIDITGGPLLKSIILYAVPVIIGALIQVSFNTADLLVLGNKGTDVDFAAVGATSQIIILLVNTFVGLTSGVSSVLARCLGQKDDSRTKSVVNTAVITSAALGLLIALALFFSADFFLDATDCPLDCFAKASLYIKLYSIGVIPMMIYNFVAAILRTTGDTTRPLVYIIIAGIVNVVLNYVLCSVLTEKVAAVAIATAASQFVGAFFTMRLLMKTSGPCKFSLKSLSYSFKELWKMVKIGLPVGINSALFSLSNLQIQAAINSYGSAATAGAGASSSIDGLVLSCANSFNSATIPFVGQNIGAENRKRVRNSIIICAVLASTVGTVLGNLSYIFGEELLALYLPKSPEAVAFGMVRMKYIVCFYGISMIYNVIASSMNAFGYSTVPMINSIVTVLGFRVVWMEFIYPNLDAANRVIDNLYLCYPISWTLCLVAHSIAFAIVYSRYKRGHVNKV